MTDTTDTLAVALFSEILMADQLARARISKALPKGMELSHFTVLNNLAHLGGQRSPAQLARAFNLSKGALTNTLSKLEWAGYIHVTPDWEDARRKQVVISPAGKAARDAAIQSIGPLLTEVSETIGADKMRLVLPILRELRARLSRVD